jgi:uncharacterized RDD family membrane protein YckC
MSEPVPSAPDLVVDSVTGVDVALPVAGPGVRAFAFAIDWHIRLILSITWYVVGVLLHNRSWNLQPPLDPDESWFLGVVLPSVALYLLYHPVLEIVMRGRTPGKRMAGVRMVTKNGSVPTTGALLTRNIFRLIDSFPAFYGVGLIATLVTRNHVRIGDMAAGTLLVYDRAHVPLLEHVSPGGAVSKMDATTAELINELLHRWPQLDEAARHRMARKVLEHAAAQGVAVANLETADEAALHAELQRVAKGAAS